MTISIFVLYCSFFTIKTRSLENVEVGTRRGEIWEMTPRGTRAFKSSGLHVHCYLPGHHSTRLEDKKPFFNWGYSDPHASRIAPGGISKEMIRTHQCVGAGTLFTVSGQEIS